MKKTLVIMGSHPNGKAFDWTRKNCELWLFNEAPNARDADGNLIYKKCDVVFQLHHEAIWKSPKNRSDEKHYEWLKSGKTPLVYMQKKYKEIPKSKKYPLEGILKLKSNTTMIVNGQVRPVRCLFSSPGYALALLAKMWIEGQRYNKVEIWGVELETETEYKYQRAGFGYWIGYLSALGVPLEIHSTIFNYPIYGYEGDIDLPASVIKARIEELNKNLVGARYKEDAGEVLNMLPGLLKKDISAEIQNALNEFTKKYEELGIISGQIKESRRYLEKAEAMEKVGGASIFSMGEFDGTRLNYNKQYIEEKAKTNIINTKLDFIMKNLLRLKKSSHKRQRAIDEFGTNLAELINNNALLMYIIGAVRENQYYLDSSKFSVERSQNGSNLR